MTERFLEKQTTNLIGFFIPSATFITVAVGGELVLKGNQASKRTLARTKRVRLFVLISDYSHTFESTRR